MPLLAQLSELSGRAVESARARAWHGPLPPGPAEPAVAQMAAWIRRPTAFLRRARDRYGETFTLRLVGMPPFVSFSDPAAVKEIFTGPPSELYAGQANVVLEPILGEHSVLLLDGAEHMRQRRLLLPPFHGQRMRAYGAAMRDATLDSMRRWPRGQPFPVHERTQEITLEVILRTVFGMDEGAELTELREALAATLDGVANPLLMIPWFRVDLGPRSPGGRLSRLLERVDRLLFGLIRRRRAEGRGEREDVLAMLLEARDEDGAPMTDQELRDELMTLLVAGHETTATSLAWCLQRLLSHPEASRRAVQEVDDAFSDGEVDPDRCRELAWVDAVVKETLRLNPVIPAVGRRLQSPLRFGGIDLPRGVIALPNIYLTHRNPRVWADPDRFAPERMLERKPSPYALFPFGGGIRRCIGMAFALYEMQVVLATILARLELEPAPGYRARLVRRSITFAPSEGMPLIVRDRRARDRRAR
ncbi:MAG TPA: cytochrome P450 [Sandaracinaceae bacterium LLY-WYZ-13_1]|nr:cytochrome P450 [Sandaracinaceae bacterium LLY-WYZ-13_1]